MRHLHIPGHRLFCDQSLEDAGLLQSFYGLIAKGQSPYGLRRLVSIAWQGRIFIKLSCCDLTGKFSYPFYCLFKTAASVHSRRLKSSLLHMVCKHKDTLTLVDTHIDIEEFFYSLIHAISTLKDDYTLTTSSISGIMALRCLSTPSLRV